MIKVTCTDNEGKLRESRGGIFTDAANSWARDYKYGGPNKILKLPVIHVIPIKNIKKSSVSVEHLRMLLVT